MRIVIFANHMTGERALSAVSSEFEISHMQRELNNRGGNWCVVQHLEHHEMLIFNSDEIYKGFSPEKKDKNYCGKNVIQHVPA